MSLGIKSMSLTKCGGLISLTSLESLSFHLIKKSNSISLQITHTNSQSMSERFLTERIPFGQTFSKTGGDIMGKNFEIKVTDNSDQVIEAKNAALRAALEAIAEAAEGYATMLAPVDTGRLKGSISHAINESEEMAIIGTNVEYAPYVEFGTSKMEAKPYLKPAIKNHISEYKDIAESYLKRGG